MDIELNSHGELELVIDLWGLIDVCLFPKAIFVKTHLGKSHHVNLYPANILSLN